MIRHVMTLVILFVLASCTSSNRTPDSTNPAHCLAAFNSADYWIKKDTGTDAMSGELVVKASALYLLDKLEKRGEAKPVHKETVEFIETTGDDPGIMKNLIGECARNLWGEAALKNNGAHWLRLAKIASERCQRSSKCRESP